MRSVAFRPQARCSPFDKLRVALSSWGLEATAPTLALRPCKSFDRIGSAAPAKELRTDAHPQIFQFAPRTAHRSAGPSAARSAPTPPGQTGKPLPCFPAPRTETSPFSPLAVTENAEHFFAPAPDTPIMMEMPEAGLLRLRSEKQRAKITYKARSRGGTCPGMWKNQDAHLRPVRRPGDRLSSRRLQCHVEHLKNGFLLLFRQCGNPLDLLLEFWRRAALQRLPVGVRQ